LGSIFVSSHGTFRHIRRKKTSEPRRGDNCWPGRWLDLWTREKSAPISTPFRPHFDITHRSLSRPTVSPRRSRGPRPNPSNLNAGLSA
jgi:hypothetical protein